MKKTSNVNFILISLREYFTEKETFRSNAVITTTTTTTIFWYVALFLECVHELKSQTSYVIWLVPIS